MTDDLGAGGALAAPYALALLRADEVAGNEILRQLDETDDPVESLKGLTGGLVAIIRDVCERAGGDPVGYLEWLCRELYGLTLDERDDDL